MKQKIKIMKHKADLSDEEIQSFMNFDKLMAGHKASSRSTTKRRLITIILSAVVVGSIGVWMLYNAIGNDDFYPEAKAPDQFMTEETLPPVTHNDSLITKGKQTVIPNEPPAKAPASQHKDVSSADSKKVDKMDKAVPDDIYVQAEPAEGYPKLYEYFEHHLKYPVASIRDSIQGVETISFTIGKDGKPEKIIIRQSLGASFDEESIRLIESMPAWKPATLNGKPVASQMSIPLTFRLESVN